MQNIIKIIAVIASAFCFFAVLIGAFGAHALSELLATNQREDVFELANRYQFYHGLALLSIAGWFKQQPTTSGLTLLVTLMVVGTIIFSGSLYLLAITNIGWLGAVTPIGGILLLAAWGILVWLIAKKQR